MMKNIFKYALIMIPVIMMSGCNPYDVDELLLSREDISLTWKGVEQIVYEPATWQMGYNSSINEFRVHDDNMGNYFIVKCSADPTDEGQELSADVQWTMTSTIKKYEGIRFEVRKVSPDGYIWLWSRAQNIGVVVRKL